MTEIMVKARTVDPVMNVAVTDVAEESSQFASAWLVLLGFVLGATLLSSVVLLAWPIVAQYAAKLY